MHSSSLANGWPDKPGIPMTESWTITHADDSTALGCERVNDWLREHNWTANPDFMARIHEPEHEAEPVVLLVKTDSSTIGGLFAQTQLSWLRISVMAVHPDHRGLGIGAALLSEAEREATSRGCKYAHVDTMDYQAPDFYQAHGYKIVATLPDWDSHGHTKFHLLKHLG
jgi:GNAT superfamily N-acetyltransferase